MPGETIHSFYNHLSNTYNEPGIGQEAVNKVGKHTCFYGVYIVVLDEADNEIMNK